MEREGRIQNKSTENSSVERLFRRSLSKEEHTVMLKRHPKPDKEATAPLKLDSFISDFASKKLDKTVCKNSGSSTLCCEPIDMFVLRSC